MVLFYVMYTVAITGGGDVCGVYFICYSAINALSDYLFNIMYTSFSVGTYIIYVYTGSFSYFN